MADEKNPRRRRSGNSDDLSQDSFVERARPDPSQPPEPVRTLEGLLGDSDRAGRRRIYFSRSLDNYAEFREEDVVYREPIPADQPPFLGLDATRVALRRDAAIEFTRVRVPRAQDDFDLDVRLGGARAGFPSLAPQTWEAECPGGTWGDCPTMVTCRCETWQITICRGATCIDVNTCDTCGIRCQTEVTCETCDTCNTQCGQPTCTPTCATCPTQCNQPTCSPTCQTCQTRCNQATCATCRTCRTRCDQWTCDPTCNPHVFTCGGGWQCP